MPSAIEWPSDGSVRGPCSQGYLYFGPKSCCGGTRPDCRPDAETALLHPGVMPVQQAPAGYLRAQSIEIAYLFGAETTGGTAEMLRGVWSEVLRTAQARGWHGPGSVLNITIASDTGEELSRRIVAEVQV